MEDSSKEHSCSNSALAQGAALRKSALELFTYAKTMAENMDAPLNPEKVTMAASLRDLSDRTPEAVGSESMHCGAADILGTLKAATVQEGLRNLALQKPAR